MAAIAVPGGAHRRKPLRVSLAHRVYPLTLEKCSGKSKLDEYAVKVENDTRITCGAFGKLASDAGVERVNLSASESAGL